MIRVEMRAPPPARARLNPTVKSLAVDAGISSQLGIHAPEHAPTHRANGYTPLAIARTVARLPIPIVNSEPLYGREVLRRDAGREAAQSTESERPAQTSVHAIGSIG